MIEARHRPRDRNPRYRSDWSESAPLGNDVVRSAVFDGPPTCLGEHGTLESWGRGRLLPVRHLGDRRARLSAGLHVVW